MPARNAPNRACTPRRSVTKAHARIKTRKTASSTCEILGAPFQRTSLASAGRTTPNRKTPNATSKSILNSRIQTVELAESIIRATAKRIQPSTSAMAAQTSASVFSFASPVPLSRSMRANTGKAVVLSPTPTNSRKAAKLALVPWKLRYIITPSPQPSPNGITIESRLIFIAVCRCFHTDSKSRFIPSRNK